MSKSLLHQTLFQMYRSLRLLKYDYSKTWFVSKFRDEEGLIAANYIDSSLLLKIDIFIVNCDVTVSTVYVVVF